MKRRNFIIGAGLTSVLAFNGCSVLRKSEIIEGEIPKRTFGKTGMKISMFGFGSHLNMALKKKPGLRDKMIKAGYHGGINFFDVYDHSNYEQFEPMGRSLREFRKDVMVSLCAVNPDEKLEEEITGAFKKFMTDYIDCYRLYTVTDNRISIMEKYKKAGSVRAMGVVAHDASTMLKYINDYGQVLDYIMLPYNFHHNRAFIKDPNNDYTVITDKCNQLGLGILGIKPMGSDDMVAFAHKRDYFSDNKANPAQAMLKYVFKNQSVNCTMTSMNSMEEVIRNLEAAYKPELTWAENDLLQRLDEESSASKSSYLSNKYKWLENWA